MEVSQRYDNVAGCDNNGNWSAASHSCVVSLTVPATMTPPIFFYIGIDNMYLNHRRMVLSRSEFQLRGDPLSAAYTADLQKCQPMEYVRNVSDPLRAPIPLDTYVQSPCGLAAWTFFNDSFSFSRSSGAPLDFANSSIAFKIDRTKRFGSGTPPTAGTFNTDPATRGGGTLTPGKLFSDPSNERFVVWMRTPALSNFRKLWGRADGVTLAGGEVVSVAIDSVWNSAGFGGKKYVVLSTSSWLGGANNFIGVAYVTIGVLCIFLALLFAAVALLKDRKLGDPKHLSWNRVSE